MKLCEIYDEGCSSLSFDYTCKIRDGTELEMETQSDTRHNLKTTPTPDPQPSLCIALFKAAPLKSMDAGLQQSNALYATGMNEKEIESADLSS